MASYRHEPRVTSKVIDMSIATIVNLETEFIIVSFAATKTGPLGMQICNGTSDFIDKFMTTDKVIASDHTSVLHTYKLLEDTPAVVFRVDTCEILSGLDDAGRLIWFDKSKFVIPVLSKLDIQANDLIEVMYLIDGDNIFYAGNPDRIPEDTKLGKDLVEVVDTPPDIKQLVTNVDYKTVDKGTPIFIGNNEYLSRDDLGNVQSYISPSAVKNIQKANYNRIRTTSSPVNLIEGDYVTIGKYDYILRTEGLTDVTSENTPIEVTIDEDVPITQFLFLSKVLDAALVNGQRNLIAASTWRPKIHCDASAYSTDMFGVGPHSESLFKSLLIQCGEGTIDFQVTCPDFSVQNNQYIVITRGDETYLFYNGQDPSATLGLDFTYKFNLGTDAMSVYGFVTETYLKLSTDQYFSQCVNTITFAEAVSDLYFTKESETSIGVHFREESSNVSIYEDSKTDIMYQYIFPTQQEVQDELIHDLIYIKMDDYVFYTGKYTARSPTEIPVRLGSKGSVTNFIFRFYNQVSLYFEAAIMKTGEVLASTDIAIEYGPVVEGTTPLTVTKDIITQSPQGKFALVQNFSSTIALFSFSYEKQEYDDRIYDLHLKYKNWTQDFEVSFDPTVVSQNGMGIYYPLVNNAQDYFTLVELNHDVDTFSDFQSRQYGNDCHGSDPTENDFVSTAQQMIELDDFYPNVLFDGGLMNSTFYKALSNLAYMPDTVGSLNAQVYIGIPEGGRDYAKIVQLRQQIGLEGFHCYYIQPCFWDTCGDFSAVFGAHLYYIKKIVQNFRSIVNEFQPPFGPNNGLINPGYLMTTELTKSDREKLLKFSVNSIVRRTSDGAYYVNQNYTAQSYESDLSEEQLARLVLLINQVADRYMQTTLGQYNTPELRSKVTKNITNMIDERFIQNHLGGLLQFRVICNEQNNTPEIIQARKIRVSIIGLYQRSIDWAQITNKVYDLAQEEEFNSVAQ